MVDHQESGGAPPEGEGSTLEVEKLGLERAVFFSDAVIAIAMTLLALELPVPHGSTNAVLWRDLGDNWHSDYFQFLLSFVVIATFWFSHHALFGKLRRINVRLLRINMGTLLMIVLLPFVTRVLGIPGDFTIEPVLYASVVAAICFLMAATCATARRDGLLRPGATDVRDMQWGLAVTGVVFLVSIPLAFWSVAAAEWSWLVLSVLAQVAPLGWKRLRAWRAR